MQLKFLLHPQNYGAALFGIRAFDPEANVLFFITINHVETVKHDDRL